MDKMILWGTSIEGKSLGFETCKSQQFLRLGLSFDKKSSWERVSLIAEGAASKCWISDTPVEHNLFVTGSCSSSMDLAWYFYQKNLLPEWGSVLAANQWAGKGQLGRIWFSPVGNIYGTLHFPASALPNPDHLSLLIGYMLIAGLADIGVEAKLKWPNDLIINRKKVGGILVEQRGDTCMVGVGINLVSCPGKLEIRKQSIPSACLKGFGIDIEPLLLWQRLVKTGRSVFNKIIVSDIADVVANINESLAFVGDHVLVEDYKSKPFEATILGLSPDGGLKLLTKSEVRVTHSATIYPLAT